MGHVYEIFVRKPQMNGPLGRSAYTNRIDDNTRRSGKNRNCSWGISPLIHVILRTQQDDNIYIILLLPNNESKFYSAPRLWCDTDRTEKKIRWNTQRNRRRVKTYFIFSKHWKWANNGPSVNSVNIRTKSSLLRMLSNSGLPWQESSVSVNYVNSLSGV